MVNQVEIAPEPCDEAFSVSLNVSENPAAKRLLDVIASILAEEYIRTARENPEIFSK
jgi:hypothetical protein